MRVQAQARPRFAIRRTGLPWPSAEQFAAFIRLSRFKFLLESLITVVLGVTVAVYAGHPFRIGDWLLVQAFISGTHLMTHYCNEYFDYPADAAQQDPTGWTGGSRVLVQGQLRPDVSLSAAFIMLFAMIALLAAIPGGVARGICVAILALAWLYTAPPVRLNYRGFGEVTTAGVLTVLTPILACYVQADAIPALLTALMIPLFLIMAARMMVMNLIDRAADLTVGKRTIATALSPRAVGLVFIGANAVAYGIVIILSGLRAVPLAAGIALLATAPLAALAAWRLLHDPLRNTARAEGAAFRATVHAAATGFAAAVGLVVATAWRYRHDPSLGGSVAVCIGLISAYTALQAAVQVSDRRRRHRVVVCEQTAAPETPLESA